MKIDNAVKALPLDFVYYQYEVNEDLADKLGLNLNYSNLSWSEVLKLVKVIEKKTPEAHLFTESLGKYTVWEAFSESILVANMPDLINLQNKKVNLNQDWFKNLIKEFKECAKSKNFVKSDFEYNQFDELQGSLFTRKSNAYARYGDMMAYFCKYNKEHKSKLIPIFTGEKSNNRIGYSDNMYSINNRS